MEIKNQATRELLKFSFKRRLEILDIAKRLVEQDGRKAITVRDIRLAAQCAGKEFLGGEPVDV